MRPILFPCSSVNQKLPSNPLTIATGRLFGVGIGASVQPTLLVILGWVCSRLDSRFERTLTIFGVFATVVYASHVLVGIHFAPARAVVAGAALVLIWLSTTDILRRLDQLFESVLAP